jgi:hypothetical protein
MKFFTFMMTIITSLFINSTHAKNIGSTAQSRQVAQPQPKPTQIKVQPPIQQPIAQKESYKDLVTYVKNAKNTWDNKNALLRSDFITHMIQKAKASNLDGFQLEALLQTARDVHGIFSDDEDTNIAILQSVDNQIFAALQPK